LRKIRRGIKLQKGINVVKWIAGARRPNWFALRKERTGQVDEKAEKKDTKMQRAVWGSEKVKKRGLGGGVRN